MSLKVRIREILRENYGDFQTDLEISEEDKLTENLIDGDIRRKKAWITYNQVILELKHTITNEFPSFLIGSL